MPIKIVIIGPESTGKSTLANDLAKHYGEQWVPEFARQYIEKLSRTYKYEDLLAIAKGQIKMEEKQEKKASSLLFCDTDLHVMDVWSRHSFGKTHKWTLKQISQREYDLYLLTNIDIPWKADPQREHPDPDMRKYFFDLYLRKIQSTGVPYEIISGRPEERLARAIEVIESQFELLSGRNR
jgi:NadR type nicotinamide-nucleotide adenylyltransferase